MVVSFIPQQVGLVYALVAIPLIVYLYRNGRFSLPIRLLLLGLSTLFGFLIFAPIAPYQFQQVLLGEVSQLGAPLLAVLFFLVLFIVLTMLVGRVYCSSICPIGAIQELLSLVPVPKISIPWKIPVYAVHLIIGIIIISSALISSICIFKTIGMRSFFFLDFTSIDFFIFTAIMAAGLFIYRPFCRFICPYGLLLTLASYFSRIRLLRTDLCIECKNCEKICPVEEAYRDSNKAECFLCGRCTQVCPVNGAIVYNSGKDYK